MVHKDKKSYLYINGQEVSYAEQTPGTMARTYTAQRDILIGKSYDAGQYYFDGKMDNVFIYNQALTAAQVAGLYADGMTGKDTNVEYDPAGNMTRDHNGYIYQWDYENHLTSIAMANPANINQPTLLAEFVYDALGRRVRRTLRVPTLVGSSAMSAANTSIIQTDYYYNGWQLLTEVVTDAGLDVSTVHYAYGNQLDEVLFYVTDDGETEEISYLVHDHLNSPAARIDSTGAIAERYEYDAYGKRKVFNADYTVEMTNQQTEVCTLTNIGFTGQRVEYFDNGNLELGYYKNRWYSPGQGRFISQDPLGVVPEGYGNRLNPRGQYKDGLNAYCYIGNGPNSTIDKYGLQAYGLPYIDPLEAARIAAKNRVPTDSSGLPECPKGYHREALPGFIPTTNGCGADGGFKAPDNPSGAYNTSFKTPCDNHDICYGTYGKSKSECDSQFLKEMQERCKKENLTHYNLNLFGDRVKRSCDSFICNRFAKTYYRAVHYMGEDAYIEAQEKSSQCVPD